MNMPIQRQSEQFGAFDTGTQWARDRSSHELPKGLAGLVNSMGPRISTGMLNTREAAWGEDATWQIPDRPSIEPKGVPTFGPERARDEYTGLPTDVSHDEWSRLPQHDADNYEWDDKSKHRGVDPVGGWKHKVRGTGVSYDHLAAKECDYCGESGHDWDIHPEARRDVAEYDRERARQEFPFGDHHEAAKEFSWQAHDDDFYDEVPGYTSPAARMLQRKLRDQRGNRSIDDVAIVGIPDPDANQDPFDPRIIGASYGRSFSMGDSPYSAGWGPADHGGHGPDGGPRNPPHFEEDYEEDDDDPYMERLDEDDPERYIPEDLMAREREARKRALAAHLGAYQGGPASQGGRLPFELTSGRHLADGANPWVVNDASHSGLQNTLDTAKNFVFGPKTDSDGHELRSGVVPLSPSNTAVEGVKAVGKELITHADPTMTGQEETPAFNPGPMAPGLEVSKRTSSGRTAIKGDNDDDLPPLPADFQVPDKFDHAKEIADSLWGAMFPPEEEEGRKAIQRTETVNHLMNNGWQPEHIKYDEDDEPYAMYQHPSGWNIKDYGGVYKDIGHAATPDTAHDVINVSRHDPDSRQSYNAPFGPQDAHNFIEKQLHGDPEETGGTFRYLTENDPRIKRYRPRQANRTAAEWLRMAGWADDNPAFDDVMKHIDEQLAGGEPQDESDYSTDYSVNHPSDDFEHDSETRRLEDAAERARQEDEMVDRHWDDWMGQLTGKHHRWLEEVDPDAMHDDFQNYLDHHAHGTPYEMKPVPPEELDRQRRSLGQHEAAWADDNPEFDDILKHIDEQLAGGEPEDKSDYSTDYYDDGDNTTDRAEHYMGDSFPGATCEGCQQHFSEPFQVNHITQEGTDEAGNWSTKYHGMLCDDCVRNLYADGHEGVERLNSPHHTALVAPAAGQQPAMPIYQPGHRVGLPWRDQVIRGTVISVDPTSMNPDVRWDDGQYSSEEPRNIQLL